MRRKLLSGCLVLGALLVLLGGTVLLRYIQNRQGKLFHKESYDENGLLMVSIKTHPELFEYMGMTDPLEYEECKPGKSGIELEFRYTETTEDGKEIEKEDVYDLFDPALLKTDWLNMSPQGWSGPRGKIAAKEDAGVLLRFTSGEIEKPYRLCIPDMFEGKPVFSIFQIKDDPFLERIDYPDSIQSVDISNCSNLKELNYSKNVRSIGISDCDALTSVRIPEHKNISFMMDGVTECNGIEELIIPDNYLAIGYIACSCGGLRRVELKEGLMLIKESFNNCPLLEEVYIPDSVIMILDSFIGCEKIVLSVGKGSAAEKYAKAKEIPFVYHE